VLPVRHSPLPQTICKRDCLVQLLRWPPVQRMWPGAWANQFSWAFGHCGLGRMAYSGIFTLALPNRTGHQVRAGNFSCGRPLSGWPRRSALSKRHGVTWSDPLISFSRPRLPCDILSAGFLLRSVWPIPYTSRPRGSLTSGCRGSAVRGLMEWDLHPTRISRSRSGILSTPAARAAGLSNDGLGWRFL